MMFVKGSRYRNLPQSQNTNTRAEPVLSVDLRFIPEVTGSFRHAVAERDRLDLLAFKYYTDPRRWWLIADANPEYLFPVDLLDARPYLSEELSLVRPSTLARTDALLLRLGALAALGPEGPLDEKYLPVTQFFSTSVILRYTASGTRPLVVDEIRRAGFHLRASFAWTHAGQDGEEFTFEDLQAKQEWGELLRTLSMLPGVRQANSLSVGETLRVEYNTEQLPRSALLLQIERWGFQIVPQRTGVEERVGARIVIPPNQAV